MKHGKLFVISGPSGVGKSTILKELLQRQEDIYFSVSATTRKPRPGEVDGVHYHFHTPEDFQQLIEEEALLEWAEYVGNFYGTPAKYVDEAMEEGRDVILDIEVQGAGKVAEKRPEAVRIFIAPPSWQELERRLTERGTDAPEKIAWNGRGKNLIVPDNMTMLLSTTPWSTRWASWKPLWLRSIAAAQSA